MPWSAPKHCSKPGHPPHREARCPLCVAAHRAASEAKRPTATARGYDSAWRQASRAFLAAHPVCVQCSAPATVTDHRVPHKGDKALFWTRSNWQPLCARCHGRKSATVDGGFAMAATPGGRV